MVRTSLLAGAVLLLVVSGGTAAEEEKAAPLKLIRVEKIWDQAPHNAFTDLVRCRDAFFCVFREGQGHVSPDGAIRVLQSNDGRKWESTALVALAGHDLRDPKITVTPDGRLMLSGGAAVREGTQPATSHRSLVAFSADGRDWGKLEWVAPADEWLWRVTWHERKAYGVAYPTSAKKPGQETYGPRLCVSDDGLAYKALVAPLSTAGEPNEGTLRFDLDGTCYCLLRRDGPPSNTALLGTSKPPYTNWQWKDLARHLGGPNFLRLPNGRWLAAGRLVDPPGAKTALCELNVVEGKLTPLLTLPSGGDTSYPGLVWHDEKLWVSYYSSHEGKTSIYLAVVSVGSRR